MASMVKYTNIYIISNKQQTADTAKRQKMVPFFAVIFFVIFDILHTYNSHHKSRAQGERIPPAPQALANGQKTTNVASREKTRLPLVSG